MEQNNNNSDYDDIINSILTNFTSQINDLTQNDPQVNNLHTNNSNNGNNRNANQNTSFRATRNPDQPLSFTFTQQPNTPSTPNTPRTPNTSRQETTPLLPEMLTHNERYTLLLNVIQNVRVVMQQYSNQMRDYQTTVTSVLQNLDRIYQDIYRDNRRNAQQQRSSYSTFTPNLPSRQNQNNESNIIQRRGNAPSWNDIVTSRYRNTRLNVGNELFSVRPFANNNQDWLTNLIMSMNQPQENVIVAPTTQQIEDATEDIIFNEENYPLINETRCPITLEDFQENQVLTRIRICGHVFSQEPFRNWFRQSVRCPVCRHDIRDNIPLRQTVSSTLNNTPPNSENSDSLFNSIPIQRMNSNESINSNVSDVSNNQPTAEFNYVMLFPTNNTLRSNQNDSNV